MPGKADIRMYFQRDGALSRAYQVVVDRKGELYTFTHGWPLALKNSHHSSGYTRMTALDLQFETRPERFRRPPLSPVDDFELVTGIGAGTAPPPDPKLQAKSNSRKAGRRSWIMPAPEFMWGCEVWAVSPDRPEFVDRLANTAPYAKSTVVDTLLVDWLSPMLLLTSWAATGLDAYQVAKISPPVPGHVPYIQVPRAYEGTWLEPYFSEQVEPDELWDAVTAEVRRELMPLT